mgnify:CR=1 FL=1
MMERKEVLTFILSEVKRLNDEEHIHDLCKAGRYKELSQVESKLTRGIYEFFWDESLNMSDEEIPEGGCLALAIWGNAIGFPGIFEDEKAFAERLAEEAGKLGKSIAYKVLVQNEEICCIECDKFFDDSDAEAYDEICN